MNIKNIYQIVFIISILIIFILWQNNAVVITKYDYKNEKLPKAFDGFRILHISDLHNKNFHGILTKKIKNINPDIIVITGDLIDRRKTNVDIAMRFINDVIEIAPAYYVSGNHEQLSYSYFKLIDELRKSNVTILDNSLIIFNHKGGEIGLMGVADPAIIQNQGTNRKTNNKKYVESNLEKLSHIDTSFNILLSHRSELFEVYKEFKVDLVFSGHAHGGQIRIPFVGGILSPNQGFFPKYSEGMIAEDETTMIVSRGLGNSIFPLRVFNLPELVVLDLYRD